MNELTSSVHRSSGVATIIRSSMPGLLSAEVEETRRIPRRYLVVKLAFDDGVVFAHNVYVPVRPPEQPTFFTQLMEQEEFDPSASHIICGDFSVAIDPRLDSKRGNRRDPSVSQLQLWLLRLNVVDALHIHNPERRVFSGPEVSSNNDQQATSLPRPRVTRLDYIFLSNVLIDEAYFQSKYFPARDGGDNLPHSVELRSSRLPRGKRVWRLPFELLELLVVRDTIRHAANLLLECLRNCVNQGKEWSQWKRHTKKQLQAIHAKLATQKKLVTERAEIEFRAALRLYNAQQTLENAARAAVAATAYKSVQDMVKKEKKNEERIRALSPTSRTLTRELPSSTDLWNPLDTYPCDQFFFRVWEVSPKDKCVSGYTEDETYERLFRVRSRVGWNLDSHFQSFCLTLEVQHSSLWHSSARLSMRDF